MGVAAAVRVGVGVRVMGGSPTSPGHSGSVLDDPPPETSSRGPCPLSYIPCGHWVGLQHLTQGATTQTVPLFWQ